MLKKNFLMFLMLIFFLLLNISCFLDADCTLVGRPSVCFTFEDKIGSPVFPEHVKYTIKDLHFTGTSLYKDHRELLSSILESESSRQISKKDLLAYEGEDLHSISVRPSADRRRMTLCIDNSMIGKYTFQLQWGESKAITQHVVEVRRDRCGPILEIVEVVLPFSLCDKELQNKYLDGQLQRFSSCPLQ